jgi:hypothetical protein
MEENDIEFSNPNKQEWMRRVTRLIQKKEKKVALPMGRSLSGFSLDLEGVAT